MTARDRFAEARRRMIEEDLQRRGIRSPAVLDAMSRVPRQRFVAEHDQAIAFGDTALSIDCGQTISQPYMVAAMTEALELDGSERVLEIGTGSGYQTAVLAELAREVFTIERHQQLSETARERLRTLGYTNVRFFFGDGSRGLPEFAPFDRILITAASRQIPPALWDQLRQEGVLVGPFGGPSQQTLQVIRKSPRGQITTSLTPCRFVPLIAEEASPRGNR